MSEGDDAGDVAEPSDEELRCFSGHLFTVGIRYENGLRVLNILCAQRGDVLASTIPQLWKPDLHSNEMDQSISGNEMGNRITRWWFQIFFMFTAI